jgi:hypothetical protein
MTDTNKELRSNLSSVTNNNKETFESKTNKVLNIDDTTWFNLPTCKILIKELKQLHDTDIIRLKDIIREYQENDE